MARARSNAFDVDREEVDHADDAQPLSTILPPTPVESSAASARGAAADDEPRGRGGRPRGRRRRQITLVPAKVPQSLYHQAAPLVKGVGRPSWGQLVAWTCRDQRDAVVRHIESLVTAWEEDRRGGPAGVANKVAEGSSQVTARMTDTELGWFLAVLEEVPEATRTEGVIAALGVALENAEGDPL